MVQTTAARVGAREQPLSREWAKHSAFSNIRFRVCPLYRTLLERNLVAVHRLHLGNMAPAWPVRGVTKCCVEVFGGQVDVGAQSSIFSATDIIVPKCRYTQINFGARAGGTSDSSFAAHAAKLKEEQDGRLARAGTCQCGNPCCFYFSVCLFPHPPPFFSSFFSIQLPV